MCEKITEYENMVAEAITNKLQLAQKELARLKLEHKFSMERPVNVSSKEYSSEALIVFTSSDGYMDTIEFFVYRNGHPAVSFEEITTYLNETMEDVFYRRRSQI